MEPGARSSASSTEQFVVDVRDPELDSTVSSQVDRVTQRSLSRETSILNGTTGKASEPPPEALLEIGNLIRIRGLQEDHTTWLRVALEDWESSSEQFKKRLDTYKKDQNVLRNEIYQGVGFFSAFQGLLLTAVAQSTKLSCKNLIFPFLLSAIATVTTVALVLQKNSLINNWESRISEEEPARKVRRHRIRCLCSYRT
ncbi:hypothetical protein BDL97_09G005000 [Sphagnum fallax]|jgi:hypothetical protein|nr:hypothetical protein BDL97_09G005000 [Sphagnum fallax]